MTKITIKTVEYLAAIEPIRSIRTEVFQIEQKVAEELEFDGLDERAIHLLAYLENKPVGTARIRKIDNETAKIERLSVLPKVRNKGIGKQLMVKAIEIITDKKKYQETTISLQLINQSKRLRNRFRAWRE